MVAPTTPAANGHLLCDRSTIKAPVKLSPSFVQRRRARRPKKASPRPMGAKVGKTRAAAATTTTITTTTTTATKGRSKNPPKATKYWMVLCPASGRRII
ncbi:hypothetical protein BZA05DRAFT_447308 [Tricharina praecox]|uniref:uncharacterized protein n=1 Tax=Tricharina praecox TaxID=43433 RepID=UPI00221F8DF2|nr:uncharacterized protein BZA05DRAFT_447308 [Tricharina praecox]KAI5846662.1 hypothetical protein BZA05DRAFT_447308 [Tricharina praecox]